MDFVVKGKQEAGQAVKGPDGTPIEIDVVRLTAAAVADNAPVMLELRGASATPFLKVHRGSKFKIELVTE